MSLVIISGRSGSGKSTALHVLEDLGYYCIDNLPVGLVPPLIQRIEDSQPDQKVAVSVDARNLASDLENFPSTITQIDATKVAVQIVYLDSANETLVKRFSETRRKHPLSNRERDLGESLELETELLDPVSSIADLTVDTTNLSIHELRDTIKTRVAETTHEFALLFESFAFKGGVPIDADLIFDVRCLPNPHWKQNLRALTGLDAPVIEFLESHNEVRDMIADIVRFLANWLPAFEANNRSYMTVAIGCTGGQHRSVYIASKLFQRFSPDWKNVQIRHREIARHSEQESLGL
ncbi:MAG: RNase adapter RapZ [Gammaproteobacteria bacterium]|nr:RNase adapter RapZ [Gammaproteobacteria bacterium]